MKSKIAAVMMVLAATFLFSLVPGLRAATADDEFAERAKAAIEEAGGTVIGSVQIVDRLEASVDIGVPNFALTEYGAPENYPEGSCPLCKAGTPVTRF